MKTLHQISRSRNRSNKIVNDRVMLYLQGFRHIGGNLEPAVDSHDRLHPRYWDNRYRVQHGEIYTQRYRRGWWQRSMMTHYTRSGQTCREQNCHTPVTNEEALRFFVSYSD